MSPLAKLYVKVFLISGIGFASIMSATNFFAGEPNSIIQFLFHGVGFGAFMSLFITTLHKEKLQNFGVHDFTDQNLGVNQKIIINSNLSEDQIVEKLKLNQATSKFKIKKIEDGIFIKSGMSWKSFGEIMLIRRKPQRINEYEISSKSSLKSTLVDYGKNLENVNKLKDIIEA